MHRALLTAAILLTACGGAEDTICDDTAAHLRSCFGAQAGSSYACNPDTAARLLSLDCKGLSQAVLGGKADEVGVEEAVREAIRQAIREAVMQAMKQVWDQVVSSLPPGISDRALYLQLYKSSSESKAQSRASDLAAALSADPDFQPTVVKTGWLSYAVLHGPCPLDPGSDLPRKIADLVMTHPELIKALGGEIQTEPSEEGAQVQISLPLTLLSFDKDAPADMGCSTPQPGEPEPQTDEPQTE